MYSLFGSQQTRIFLVHFGVCFLCSFLLQTVCQWHCYPFVRLLIPQSSGQMEHEFVLTFPNAVCILFCVRERERESFAGTSLKSAQKARKLFLFRFVVVFFFLFFCLFAPFSHANAALHLSFVVDFYARHNSRNGHWFDFASPPQWSLPSIIGTLHPPSRCSLCNSHDALTSIKLNL